MSDQVDRRAALPSLQYVEFCKDSFAEIKAVQKEHGAKLEEYGHKLTNGISQEIGFIRGQNKRIMGLMVSLASLFVGGIITLIVAVLTHAI